MRILFSKFSFLSLVTLTVLAGYCPEGFPGTEQFRDLKLEVSSGRQQATVGDEVPVEVTITNTGSGVINACLSEEGISYSWKSLEYVAMGGGLTTEIDHPVCQEQFTLNPGEAFKTNTTVKILEGDISVGGKYKVETSWNILDPAACGVMGCPGVEVDSSSEMILEIIVPKS